MNWIDTAVNGTVKTLLKCHESILVTLDEEKLLLKQNTSSGTFYRGTESCEFHGEANVEVGNEDTAGEI